MSCATKNRITQRAGDTFSWIAVKVALPAGPNWSARSQVRNESNGYTYDLTVTLTLRPTPAEGYDLKLYAPAPDTVAWLDKGPLTCDVEFFDLDNAATQVSSPDFTINVIGKGTDP